MADSHRWWRDARRWRVFFVALRAGCNCAIVSANMKWIVLAVALALSVLAGLVVALVLGYRATIRRYIQWSDGEGKKPGGGV